MKKLNVLMMLFMVIAVSSVTFANNNPGEEEEGYTMMTVAELKAQYGAENLQLLSSLELLDTDVVMMAIKPCNGEKPCPSALQKAQKAAQALADECCCVRFYGVICCQPSTGALIAIDGIVIPDCD